MAGMEGQDVNTEGNSMRFEGVPKRFSYGELSVATGLFSNESKLGQGGFGSVYRGRLQSGTLVAVKRMNSSMQSQGRKAFRHEVAILIELRHRNLIELRGWCEDRDRSEFLLVYELAPNGDLDDALFRAGLSWPQRLSILTGTAAALDYLHQGWKRQVLHRDVKCSNIMLDEDWNAKLGDFGISRMVDHECDAATMTMVGTFGYMAPELFAVGRFTDKSDVYAFGVVVLEVLCGRRVLPKRGSQELGLVPFVRDVFQKKGDLLSVVDKQLTGYDKHKMVAVLEVGLQCTSENPNDRPSMRKVVYMLEMDPSSNPVVTETKHSWEGSLRSLPQRERHSSSRGSEDVASSSSVWVKHDPIPHPITDPIPQPITDPIPDPIPDKIVKRISYDKIVKRISHETLRMATDGFRRRLKSGFCSRGYVYGRLENEEVAVKYFPTLFGNMTKEEFFAAVDILIRVDHINIVSLVAYCHEKIHHESGHMAFVYEYAANGNLREWIYGRGTNADGMLKLRGTLDWSKRLQVALDAAQGLEHLHKKCYPGIIHGNVNSTNILLDQSMVAKVAGLHYSECITTINIAFRTWDSNRYYRPPEYHIRGELPRIKASFKSDVYSFGVVLAEIIIGLPPSKICEKPAVYWQSFMYMKTEDILELVDPKLQGEYNMKSMRKMAKLVLLCVRLEENRRPDIDEVVRSIKEALELAKT